MADFLTTRELSFRIEEIIQKAKKRIYMITPYIKLSRTIIERLKQARARNIEINVVYGKRDLKTQEEEVIRALDCNIFFVKDLHAKCYANEENALVSSMNLYTYSEVNNYEMGVLLNFRGDKKAYYKCLEEIRFLINSAVPIKKQKDFHPKQHYSNDDFEKSWFDLLKREFSQATFISSGNNMEAKNFPLNGVDFSTYYGVGCFEFDYNEPNLRRRRDNYGSEFFAMMEGYRVYWSHPYHKISMYKSGSDFSTLKEDLEFHLQGLNKIIAWLEKVA